MKSAIQTTKQARNNFVRGDFTGELTRLRFWAKDTIESPMQHHKLGLSYTASGYGEKIPTTKMVKLGTRWHRVYCMIYGNSGTLWIQTKDGRYIVSFEE